MSSAHIVTTPLTTATALSSWRLDVPVLVVVAALGLGYWRCSRHGGVAVSRAASFSCGLALWAGARAGFLGVYADTLFWVRALQFTVLFFVVPFLLALGKPLTALRGALGETGKARFDAALSCAPARFLTYPLATAASVLVLPWVVYMTPLYPALLEHEIVDQAAQFVVVLVGFGYFYSRLQSDPTPKKYPQLITLLLTVAEVIGDGALGLVLALGDVLSPAHYAARSWGPSLRMDQTIGAGILWILGDVLGVPFIFAVMRSLRAEERHIEEQTDIALDQLEKAQFERGEPQTSSGLWWESDPQLRDRFRR
ncbi:cytochrome c oxidase assembly protein [Segniliparus rugosus]|uniref:Cytochrome c oxidase assembly protein n=1 Tax=Segniliparus rugosus (strain ATCC BAA-974 / DSM 45345 / CCUG 50838 / CIP 108380 / JCM 13579 / CDC 945) TaxID=679197 RepID=E5XTW9_SEGRC|nr:cytochrome c oxidase assembly protein [Segniliparus rugosus]EFV12208.1 hypothetical protein HMPREF9336_02941 [Segniliparus rugosus ATCC BAA-974]